MLAKRFKDLLFDKKNNAFRILYTIKSNILVYYQLRVVNDFVFFCVLICIFNSIFMFQTNFFRVSRCNFLFILIRNISCVCVQCLVYCLIITRQIFFVFYFIHLILILFLFLLYGMSYYFHYFLIIIIIDDLLSRICSTHRLRLRDCLFFPLFQHFYDLRFSSCI